MHQKPVILLNVDGFFNNFLRMVDDFFRCGFVDEATRAILNVVTTTEEALDIIENYVPPVVGELLSNSTP